SESLAAAFRQNALDIAFVVGAEGEEARRWRAPLSWFGAAGGGRASRHSKPLALVVPPPGSAVHEAAVTTLRAAGRAYDIVCASADFVVLSDDANACERASRESVTGGPGGRLLSCRDNSLPPLPPVTLSLLARSQALASSGREWVADAVASLQPL